MVSIHAPREGCDKTLPSLPQPHQRFQFTHPGRGATIKSASAYDVLKVSIHAPREGCDRLPPAMTTILLGFNSRTPGGVRLGLVPVSVRDEDVSIHAPREGCDSDGGVSNNWSWEFQFTHPGRGATVCGRFLSLSHTAFQFTHPGRGATVVDLLGEGEADVSIHAPREGCDRVWQASGPPSRGFQFTHPGRGATTAWDLGIHPVHRFNSRTPGGVRLGCTL